MEAAMKRFFLALCLCAAGLSGFCAHCYPEKTYQAHWCSIHNGKQEVILNDKARADCVTKTHAIEFDFASKWAESIGQALYYAIATGLKPGIVLILENPQKEQKYLARVNAVAKKHGITVWTMKTSDLFVKNSCPQR